MSSSRAEIRRRFREGVRRIRVKKVLDSVRERVKEAVRHGASRSELRAVLNGESGGTSCPSGSRCSRADA